MKKKKLKITIRQQEFFYFLDCKLCRIELNPKYLACLIKLRLGFEPTIYELLARSFYSLSHSSLFTLKFYN